MKAPTKAELNREALRRILDEGAREITDPDTGKVKRAVTDAVTDAYKHAACHPDCEVRVKFKTTGAALLQFKAMQKWLTANRDAWREDMVRRHGPSYVEAANIGFIDPTRTSLMQIELTNGSCLIFGTE